jgi:8-amino-7-oxononanoate synthase
MAFVFMQRELAARKEQSLLRQRQCIDSAAGALIEVAGQHFINFSSNDYLGMRRSAEVAQAWVDGISEYGGGSGASPLVTGYTKAHRELEDYLAAGLGRDKVLLFNSGFAANQAICQALLQVDSELIADKLIHASLIDGAQSCDGKLVRYRHNDVEHLEQVLAKSSQVTDKLVATEGIFSMDGDRAPLEAMLPIVTKHQAWLMLDDAHGMGVLGAHGLGTAEALSLSQQQLPILMGTFGKAIGTAGAFVAGSAELIDYLINFSRHYIYSTAMPAAQAHATTASLITLQKPQRRELLLQRITQFKQLAQRAGITLLPSDSAIQAVLVGSAEQALKISDKLKSLGIWATAIRYPTVPKGTDRLRLTLSSLHQEQDIQALIDALQLSLHVKD